MSNEPDYKCGCERGNECFEHMLPKDSVSIKEPLPDDEIKIFEAVHQYSYPRFSDELLVKMNILDKFPSSNRMRTAEFRCEPRVCELSLELSKFPQNYSFLAEYNQKYGLNLTEEDCQEMKKHRHVYLRVGKIKKEYLLAGAVEIKDWEGEEWIEINKSTLKLYRIKNLLLSNNIVDKNEKEKILNDPYDDIKVIWFSEYYWCH